MDANDFGRWLLGQASATLDIENRTLDLAIFEDVFWAMVRKRVTEDPQLAAEKTGLPFHRLHQFKEPEPSLLLADMWKWFSERKKDLTPQTVSDNKRYWTFFKKTIQVKTIAEITVDVVEHYNSTLHATLKRDKRSPAWLNNQIGLVRQVFTHAETKGKDADRLSKVIKLLGGLERVDKQKTNSLPISRKHFHKWYAAADVKYKAILLVMLNAAMRPQDVADLLMVNPDGSKVVDFDAGTIVTYRKKKGRVVRCCCLWPRTLDAIRQYQQQEPHDQATLFVNDLGMPFASGRVIGNNLRDYRGEAGLPTTVKAEHLRDGAITAAVAAKIPPIEIDILSGHVVGIDDEYLKRGAYMVKDACLAIEKHYFG